MDNLLFGTDPVNQFSCCLSTDVSLKRSSIKSQRFESTKCCFFVPTNYFSLMTNAWLKAMQAFLCCYLAPNLESLSVYYINCLKSKLVLISYAQ